MNALQERHVREIYTKYRNGDGITDAELIKLLEAIDNAIPLLEASSAFGLVSREAWMDREALRGFLRARAEKGSAVAVHWKPQEINRAHIMQVREAYVKYQHGAISDAEITCLLAAIEPALPFLNASPMFSLIYREATTDCEALKSCQDARQRS